MNLNNRRSNTNSNIGFRSALVLFVRNFKRKALVGSTIENGPIPPAVSRKNELLVNYLVAIIAKGNTINLILFKWRLIS